MLTFRQLADPTSSTYTYLLADPASAQAVLVDPVFDQVLRDAALLDELGLTLVATVDTHVHADHVTGAWLHKHRRGSLIAVSAASGAEGADRYLADGDTIAFGSRHLVARATPGHTAGCMTLVLDDASLAMTGDCLLIRGCGRTDFQEGDARRLFRSVREQIFTLPDETRLLPAHDYRGRMVTTVGEEKRFNPRLGMDRTEAEFVGIMRGLRLAYPKKMDEAVPANLLSGLAPAAQPRPGPTVAGLVALAGRQDVEVDLGLGI